MHGLQEPIILLEFFLQGQQEYLDVTLYGGNMNDWHRETATGPGYELESIQDIRNRLANLILLCISVLGAPITFISFLRYLDNGGLIIFTTHTFIYLLCVAVTVYRNKIHAKNKILFITLCTFLMGLSSIIKWGIVGTGIAYYIFCSILVTIFYGKKPGITATLFNLLTMIITAVFFKQGYLNGNFDLNSFSSSFTTWITASSVYGCFTLILVICLNRLYNSMAVSIEKLGSRTSELNAAKKEMETEIRNRTIAETALRESEERFRTVLENLPCGVSVHDLDGNHLMVNEEACRERGYTREELSRLTVMETSGPEFSTSFDAKKIWREMEPGASFSFETKTSRKDGSTYDSEVHLTKIILEGKQVILSLVFDITDRKKIEDNLARHSDLERLISEISSKIVGLSHFEVDAYIEEALGAIGKKTEVDHAYLFLFNPESEEIDNINEWCIDDKVPSKVDLQDLDSENDLPWFREKLKTQEVLHVPDIDALPSEAAPEKEYFSARHIKSLVVMVIRQGGNLLGYLGFDNIYEQKSWSDDEIVILRLIGETFLNAIQRKKAEKEQEKLQAQLTTGIELANLGPWEYDVETNLFTFNDHFYRIYRTTAEEIGGYTMTPQQFEKRFVHPDDAALSSERFQAGLKAGEQNYARVESRMLYADGEMGYAMAQIFISRDSKGNPIKIYGVNQDITEWKIAQEKLRESEEKLARSRKMESLGLLAGGVAHDLNNVLSGIVSYPELILLDLPEDSALRRPIKTIQDSGNRAVAIVQDLLTIARGAATAKEPLNLNMIIKEYLMSPEFNHLKKNNPMVEYRTELEEELFNFHGSQIHIKKAVMNLVANASEAIETGGSVIITTNNRYVDMPLSKYEDVNIGEYVVLTITDNGPGISPENLDRIFEPFFTKKVMGISGTGLGLTVVWNTVQDHSGYIDITSDKKGTRFELYFPITRDELVNKTSVYSIDDIKGRGETVMVVDDVENQREISCKMLETLGYNYIAFSGGEEAVEYLKTEKADIILLDMIMAPGISGRETYERIAKINPGQKAVIVSGYSENEDVLAIQKLGAGSYIKKPFSLETLGRGIKSELGK